MTSKSSSTKKADGRHRKNRRFITLAGTLSVIATALVIFASLCTKNDNIIQRNLIMDPKTVVHKHQQVSDESMRGLIWLMAYPDSGGKFVTKTIEEASNVEVFSSMQNSESVKQSIITSGGKNIPGINSPVESSHVSRDLPGKYVVKETECGVGKPTMKEFFHECSLINQPLEDGNNVVLRYNVKETVGKAIHLVRNPFDSIVSEFNHRMHDKDPSGKSQNMDSFLNYCRQLDEEVKKLEPDIFKKHMSAYAEEIPCISEFYRYILWHNQAFQTTNWLQVPVLPLNLEDFYNYDATLESVMSFVEMPQVGKPSKFQGDHFNYYTQRQKGIVMEYLRSVAVSETWKVLRVYFVPALRTINKYLDPIGLRAYNSEPSSPKLLWLMTFPNSGTSFTVRAIEKASNADNFETIKSSQEVKDTILASNGNLIPGINAPILHSHVKRNIPSKYVVKNTHGHGYCPSCALESTLENQVEFEKACSFIAQPLPDGKKMFIYYDPKIVVNKAIHLFRNPFDNIVSRFNFYMKQIDDVQNPFYDLQPRTKEGFLAYCKQLDEYMEKSQSKIFQKYMSKSAKSIPCISEFFRYVQWHNLAFETIKGFQIPQLIIHYEDYHLDYNDAIDKLLSFIETPRVGASEKFKWHDYPNYYSDEEHRVAITYIMDLASDETSKQLKYYFGEPVGGSVGKV